VVNAHFTEEGETVERDFREVQEAKEIFMGEVKKAWADYESHDKTLAAKAAGYVRQRDALSKFLDQLAVTSLLERIEQAWKDYQSATGGGYAPRSFESM
jgi:hypothetical protein